MIRNSIGTKLFFYVLGGALVGLGGMACLFYGILEHQAKTEIRSHLETQAALIEGQIARAEQAVFAAASAIETAHNSGITDADFYKQLAFRLFQRRSPITTGVGFGQTPYQLVRDRKFFSPYFFIDQNTPNQVGEALPAPDEDIRYIDVGQIEDYTQGSYYKLPVETGRNIWLEPYIWERMTITTFTMPMYSDRNQILGQVGIDINVNRLQDTINIPVFRGEGFFSILSETGNLLAYPPDVEKANNLATYRSVSQLIQVWPQIKRRYGILQMEGKYWAYQRIQGTNWLMLAVVPQWAVVQPVLMITLGSTLGAGLVLALVIHLFVQHLNQRLKPMLNECRKLVEADIQRVERLHLYDAEATYQGRSQLALTLEGKDELGTLEASFHHMTAQLRSSFEELEQRVAERTEDLSTALKKLQQSQLQLVQSEKMSSLGQLVAGIAHEINNPINFIHGNLTHLQTYTQDLLNLVRLYQQEFPTPTRAIALEMAEMDLAFLQEDVQKLLQSVQGGTDRIREAVRSLRNFSRLDEAERKVADIQEGIDNTLTILSHRLESSSHHPDLQARDIQIIKAYENVPLIECYPGQLNQVFMNILNNAIDAIEERNETPALTNGVPLPPGQIRISTALVADQHLLIRIEDNGIGMSEAVRSRIFDPFFSTKPVGKGTGLGLSISYQIIVGQHQGQLECESKPGQGSIFTIQIPLRPLPPSSPLIENPPRFSTTPV